MSPNTMRFGSSASVAFDCFAVSYIVRKIFLEPKPFFMRTSLNSSAAGAPKHPSHRLGKSSHQETLRPGCAKTPRAELSPKLAPWDVHFEHPATLAGHITWEGT